MRILRCRWYSLATGERCMSNGKSAPPSGGAHDRAEIEAVQERIARRLRDLKTFDPSGIQDRWDTRLEGVQKNVNKLVGEAFGMGTALYRQHAIGPLDAALDATFGDRYTMQEFHDEVRKAVTQASARLATVSKLLNERLAAVESAPAAAPESTA